MPKHAVLNVQNPNGTFDWIFVHHADEIEPLLSQYNTPSAARELMALGDLSVLKSELHPPIGAAHTYKAPIANVTVAYHRDCGYPKASCLHLGEPESKRKMDYEFNFETKSCIRDRTIKYFIFTNGWIELSWQPHKWARNIIP
jgi:hypothetical protein